MNNKFLNTLHNLLYMATKKIDFTAKKTILRLQNDGEEHYLSMGSRLFVYPEDGSLVIYLTDGEAEELLEIGKYRQEQVLDAANFILHRYFMVPVLGLIEKEYWDNKNDKT